MQSVAGRCFSQFEKIGYFQVQADGEENTKVRRSLQKHMHRHGHGEHK
jgi:hypothetical protein